MSGDNLSSAAESEKNEELLNSKGKGKAQAEESVPVIDDEDNEESEEDEADGAQDDNDEGDEDDMAEIDEDNIVEGGRRTRGKAIDFAKAAEGLEDEDMDEDEDEDFVDPDESMQE